VKMLLFLLICGHALCDYPLQSDFMAKEKNPWNPIDMNRVPPGQKPQIFWYWVLSSHALIHGGCVALITGSLGFGIAETVCHWIIDIVKCAGWTNIDDDQFMHVCCKILWWFLLSTYLG